MNKFLEMKMPKDLSKIDPNNLGELVWWSAHLGVGFERLLEIIDKAGQNSIAVREYLQKRISSAKNKLSLA